MQRVRYEAAALAAILALANARSAWGDIRVLTFEGLADHEQVLDYYNGGLGGWDSGPGVNFGVQFNADALALIDFDAGGTGNFGGEPSGSTILYFAKGTQAVMNVPAGFDTGFSFYYSTIAAPGWVEVYDGLDGGGALLGSFDLPLTPFFGEPDPTGAFSPLLPIGVGFGGVARSVVFGGVENGIGFDNVTFGSPNPVPEPGTAALAAVGAAALGGMLLRRRTRCRIKSPTPWSPS